MALSIAANIDQAGDRGQPAFGWVKTVATGLDKPSRMRYFGRAMLV
jgi:hypothetical protein